jgi:hypothetical protein
MAADGEFTLAELPSGAKGCGGERCPGAPAGAVQIDESRQVRGAALGEIAENLKLSRQFAAETATPQGELDRFGIETAFDNAGDPSRILGVWKEFVVRGGVAGDGNGVRRTAEKAVMKVTGLVG